MTAPPVELAPAAIEAIARRAAELITVELQAREPGPRGLVDAAAIAARYDVTRAWIYKNATLLGAVRLGKGEKAPLRFDLEKVAEALASCSAGRGSQGPQTRAIKRSSRHQPRKAMGTAGRLLPIRGLGEAKSPTKED